MHIPLKILLESNLTPNHTFLKGLIEPCLKSTILLPKISETYDQYRKRKGDETIAKEHDYDLSSIRNLIKTLCNKNYEQKMAPYKEIVAKHTISEDKQKYDELLEDFFQKLKEATCIRETV